MPPARVGLNAAFHITPSADTVAGTVYEEDDEEDGEDDGGEDGEEDGDDDGDDVHDVHVTVTEIGPPPVGAGPYTCDVAGACWRTMWLPHAAEKLSGVDPFGAGGAGGGVGGGGGGGVTATTHSLVWLAGE